MSGDTTFVEWRKRAQEENKKAGRSRTVLLWVGAVAVIAIVLGIALYLA